MVTDRKQLVSAGRGEQELDLLIEGARLVNVYTGEIYPADIGIFGGVIIAAMPAGSGWYSARETYPAEGKFAVPGLIDTHIHIESSMMTPAGYARAVLPRGTTTVVIDPHEIGNVLGLEGVRYMLEATANLPLRVYVQAPSCVPSVPGLETAGADFGAAEIAEMLSWERVIGLAEVMDYVGVIQQSERMSSILGVALERGTVISGHCPEVRGKDLAAYMLGGPVSDHESKDPDELLEKLRFGMTVEGRISSFSGSMTELGAIVKRLGYTPPNLVFCTDDIYPDDLLKSGHLDEVVRAGIAGGIPPVDVIRVATYNGAQRHRLHRLGALAPGMQADIVLTASLEQFTADEVFVDGKLVARKGRMMAELPEYAHPLEKVNTVRLKTPLSLNDFHLWARAFHLTEWLNVLVVKPNLRRELATMEAPLTAGRVDIASMDDVCLAALIERHGRNGNRSLVPVKGMGLRRGAAASTVAHDCHNLIVVGRSAEDMLLAAQELERCGGGFCTTLDGKVTACVPLPVAGLLSPAPIESLAMQLEGLNCALKEQGMGFAQPLNGLLSLALPVIPAYGMTDLGLVDITKQELLSVYAREY